MKLNKIMPIFLLSALTLMSSQVAQAASFQFVIGGFAGGVTLGNEQVAKFNGGKITGKFKGVDKNGDGRIVGEVGTLGDELNELTDIPIIKLSGNPYFDRIGSMSLDRDVVEIDYDIGNNLLKLTAQMDDGVDTGFFKQMTGLEVVDDNFILSTFDFRLNNNGTGGALGTFPFGHFVASDSQGNLVEIGSDPFPQYLDSVKNYQIDLISQQPVTVSVSAVPLPGAVMLFMTGIGWLAAFGRKPG